MSEVVKSALEKYINLNEDEWQTVLSKWDFVEYKKNEFLLKEGQIEHYFYIMNDGVVRLYFENNNEDVCLGFSFNHSWSGGYDSFVTQKPSKFFLQALSEASMFRISYQNLQQLYEEVPKMERFGRLILEELITARTVREVEMMSMDTEERYNIFMSRSAHLLQLIPQKHIASYLRMTPETFSRLRAKIGQ